MEVYITSQLFLVCLYFPMKAGYDKQFNIECTYMYTWVKDKNHPVSVPTVMLTSVSNKLLSSAGVIFSLKN